MEYLKRIETLERAVSSSKKISIGLIVLLGLFMIFVPQALKNSNPTLVQTEKGVAMASVEPWKLSTLRIESFTKAYLSARFQWDESSFEQQRKALATLTDPTAFARLKDSMQAFEALANSQKAKSYYVLEGFAFTNAQAKIEAHVTRVLRIQGTALATPIVVRLSYVEAALTPENPYGLKVNALDESQPGSN